MACLTLRLGIRTAAADYQREYDDEVFHPGTQSASKSSRSATPIITPQFATCGQSDPQTQRSGRPPPAYARTELYRDRAGPRPCCDKRRTAAPMHHRAPARPAFGSQDCRCRSWWGSAPCDRSRMEQAVSINGGRAAADRAHRQGIADANPFRGTSRA